MLWLVLAGLVNGLIIWAIAVVTGLIIGELAIGMSAWASGAKATGRQRGAGAIL